MSPVCDCITDIWWTYVLQRGDAAPKTVIVIDIIVRIRVFFAALFGGKKKHTTQPNDGDDDLASLGRARDLESVLRSRSVYLDIRA